MQKNQIFNIPNILAFIRLLLAPIMFFLLVNRDSSLLEGIHFTWLDYMAAFIFVLASATDFFDGYIARTFDQVTTLGAILDPLADKMLTLAGFFGIDDVRPCLRMGSFSYYLTRTLHYRTSRFCCESRFGYFCFLDGESQNRGTNDSDWLFTHGMARCYTFIMDCCRTYPLFWL